MPSEFYAGSVDSREPTPSNDAPLMAGGQKSLDSSKSTFDNAETTTADQASEAFAKRAGGYVFGTPTSQDCTHTYPVSSVNSLDLGLERQAARDEIGMTPLLQRIPSHNDERGVLGLLATSHERVLHFVQGCSRRRKSISRDSHKRIIEPFENPSKSTQDSQSLASQEQHVVFSDLAPKKGREQSAVIEGTSGDSGSSESLTPGRFSNQPRKTPYPSPVVLGELIMQQAMEEADGSNDDDLVENPPKKKVRLALRQSTRASSSSSSSSHTFRSRTTNNSRSSTSDKHRNRFGNTIRRILFKKPKMTRSLPPRQRMSLSASAHTTVSVNIGAISPTLPQGGIREIFVEKQIPPLMIKGLDRDFLPTEATFVPTPAHTPILGGPLSFDEAISTIAPSTDPTPPLHRMRDSLLWYQSGLLRPM